MKPREKRSRWCWVTLKGLNLEGKGIKNSEKYKSVDAPDNYRGLCLVKHSTPKRGRICRKETIQRIVLGLGQLAGWPNYTQRHTDLKAERQ